MADILVKNMRQIRKVMSLRRYQLALIAFVVLALYYPILSVGFCSVDDATMMHGIKSSPFSWIKPFVPGNRFYYRPLLNLSFRFDQWMWDFMPSFMHLENLLLHLANTILVYSIARCFFRRGYQDQPWAALLAGLLFGLHPLATESVNWISGRTDPLAGLFVLLSVLALFQALETARYRWALAASLAYTIGALCKEVMVFFLPAAVILICLYPVQAHDSGVRIGRRKVLAVFCAPLVLLLVAFLSVRWSVRGDAAMGFSDLVARNRYAPWDLIRVFFKVSGFYVKKLFWPMPLNFAIVKISDLYAWLGVACFGGLVLQARRRPWLWTPWIVTGLLLVPAFVIAVADVTWAPLAERYVYLASAFWAIGLVGVVLFVTSFMSRTSWGMVLLVLLIGCFTVATVHRNKIWQDNVLLFVDTVAKSPNHIGARNQLGNALFFQGKLLEAKRQYEIALSFSEGELPPLSFNMARVYLAMKEPDKARKVLLEALGDKDVRQASLSFLKKLAQADASLMEQSEMVAEQQRYGAELLDLYEAIYVKMTDPVILFRGGQLAQRLGQPQRAAQLYSRAHAVAPPDAFYRKLAGKLAKELTDETTAPLD